MTERLHPNCKDGIIAYRHYRNLGLYHCYKFNNINTLPNCSGSFHCQNTLGTYRVLKNNLNYLMCFSRVSLSIALFHLPEHILQHQASYTKLGTRIREFYLASISWRRTFHGYYSPFFGGYCSKSYQINISLIHSEELLFGLWSVESMTISPCNNFLQFCDDFSMVGRQEII